MFLARYRSFCDIGCRERQEAKRWDELVTKEVFIESYNLLTYVSSLPRRMPQSCGIYHYNRELYYALLLLLRRMWVQW